jgi:hypothetical protein
VSLERSGGGITTTLNRVARYRVKRVSRCPAGITSYRRVEQLLEICFSKEETRESTWG